MEMPKPTAHHERLMKLAGYWVGEEKLEPSPWGPGGAALGRFDSRVALDGFYLITDYVEEKDGKVVFRGHGVYGWDAKKNAYTQNWFDTASPGSYAPPVLGQFEGDRLVFTHEAPGIGHTRYGYELLGERFGFKIETSKDGKTWFPVMEGRYTRR